MKTKQTDLIMQNKVFAWIAAGTLALLTIPYAAMQFGTGVNWTAGDFFVMGLMLFSFSSIFVVVARIVPRKHRLPAAIISVLLFLWLWVELAVGLFTNWGS